MFNTINKHFKEWDYKEDFKTQTKQPLHNRNTLFPMKHSGYQNKFQIPEKKVFL